MNCLKGGIMMKKGFIALFLAIFILGCSKAPRDIYNTLNNVYSMDLYLDTSEDSLEVEGELFYKNDDFDLDELYLTIYPNASNPRGAGNNIVFEYFQIDGVDTTYDVSGTDNTSLHVDLSTTLLKGERITISYKYTFLYWNEDRIANYGSYYLTMFFYPFVNIYDDEGWNIEPYSFRGETYYNNLGDYYVSLNVPSDYEVACGGGLWDDSKSGGRRMLEYVLKDARDFSFSASNSYYIYERTIEDIDFQIYSTRVLADYEIDNSFGYLETTLMVMEREIGEYYYDHFTLEYGHFYGMESTAVIYCSMEIQEGTVVHEMIHQWFYSMIGNDQADESFVDEALTTYATAFYYYELYGVDGYNGYLDYRTSLKVEFVDRYQANLGVSLLRQVDEYGEYYGYLIYYHGPAMFRYYVDVFLDGDIEKMEDILGVYYQTYAKKIATLDELLDLIEDQSGVEITKEWFYLQLNEFQDFDNRP